VSAPLDKAKTAHVDSGTTLRRPASHFAASIVVPPTIGSTTSSAFDVRVARREALVLGKDNKAIRPAAVGPTAAEGRAGERTAAPHVPAFAKKGA